MRSCGSENAYALLLASFLFCLIAVLSLIFISTSTASGSSITQWNSVTKNASNNVFVDIGIDESKEVEFIVSSSNSNSKLSYEWMWSVNGEEVKESEGKSSEFSYAFGEYGIYNISVVGKGDGRTETECAYWNVTVWLVIEGENDVRELEGLEDYTLRIAKKPERIVSMAPSSTEILFAVGAGDSVVGVTSFCNYPPEVEDKVNNGDIAVIGGYSTPSLEKIVDLEPDLIVCAYGNPDDVIYSLIELGEDEEKKYLIYAQHSKNFDEIFTHIKVTGAITKCEDEASSLLNELKEKLNAIEENTELLEEEQRPRVYYAMGSLFMTTGSGTFQHDIINTAGGRNIAAKYFSSWGPFSIEHIVEEDPQVIIYSSHGSASLVPEQIKSAELKTVDAVKNNRIYPIDENIMSRPGPRVVDAVEIVHGNLSGFFNIVEEEAEKEEEEKGEEDGYGDEEEGDSSSYEKEKEAIKAGEERTIELDDEYLTNISIKAKEDKDVEFTNIYVNVSKELSISHPPGIVYRYLNITADNLTGSVDWLKLNFRVNKSWIAANADNNTTAISLFWYDYINGSWAEQNTTEIGEGDSKVYYTAIKTSFGTFAICAPLKLGHEQSQLSVPEDVVMPITPLPTSTPAYTPPATTTPTPKPLPTPLPMPRQSGFEVVFAVIGLLAVMFLLRRKKN
ncbi:PGF-pre-PGF domain-containing protein [Methanophagales archaeon]|nr:MAG: PGF-pre-PGF domain-containing protein [Methanophagales archaeon]